MEDYLYILIQTIRFLVILFLILGSCISAIVVFVLSFIYSPLWLLSFVALVPMFALGIYLLNRWGDY